MFHITDLKELSDIMILVQIPVVVSLFLLGFQAYKVSRLKEFRFLCIGWLINIVHLVIKLSAKSVNPQFFEIINAFSDLIATYFFFLASYHSTEIKFMEKIKNIPLIVFQSLFAVIAIIKILPNNPENDFIPYIIVREIPSVLINVIVIFLISQYLKILSKRYEQTKLLYWPIVIYSFLQLLGVLQQDSFGEKFNNLINDIGFSVGFICKFSFLIGLQLLLLKINNIQAELQTQILVRERELELKNSIAKRLDDILGKTFHEVTNPLIAIGSYLGSLLPVDRSDRPTKVDVYRKNVEDIYGSYNHIIAIITASMKTYERDTGQKFESDFFKMPTDNIIEFLSVNTIIQFCILKIKTLTLENVQFNCDYGGKCDIKCNFSELTQVFVNLFKNSFEAFPENIGKISIKTRIIRENPHTDQEVKKVVIIIEDNGPGIDDLIREKLFIPGESTKSKTGRGYGLSIVKDLVEKNGGTIILVSNSNDKPNKKGAIFQLSFITE